MDASYKFQVEGSKERRATLASTLPARRERELHEIVAGYKLQDAGSGARGAVTFIAVPQTLSAMSQRSRAILLTPRLQPGGKTTIGQRTVLTVCDFGTKPLKRLRRVRGLLHRAKATVLMRPSVSKYGHAMFSPYPV